MRGGALPPALLAAALGAVLAFAPRQARLAGVTAFVVAALATVWNAPDGWTESLFLGCWASVAICAACVHLPGGPGPRGSMLLAVNAGIWAGAVIGVAGSPLDLARSLPLALIAFPARWLVGHGMGIFVKVIASWLIAVAVLAAALPLTPTPGYVPDHMQ